jgi:nucleoside-diphosphate-sugar epimerase
MYNIIKEDVNNIISRINFDYLNNKSVLVTGASGLVGLYFMSCLRELKKKYNIQVYATFKSDINNYLNDTFDFDCNKIQCDINDFKSDIKFDLIIHAAGYGQPGKFLDNKIKTIQINTTATINLFNYLNDGGKFFFVSTSELYSGNDNFNISENEIGSTNTTHPRACYIEGKRCGETICHSYYLNGYDVKVGRLSLAYGPGTKHDDKRVLNSFIEKAIKNNKNEMMDSGDSIRTYCYISDVIEIMWNIILTGKDFIYNIGGKSQTSILDLAKLIGDILNVEVISPPNTNGMDGNPKIVNISIDKYLNEFEKNDFIPLSDGIKNTILWQKNIHK